jgi:hypothetical protein
MEQARGIVHGSEDDRQSMRQKAWMDLDLRHDDMLLRPQRVALASADGGTLAGRYQGQATRQTQHPPAP